MSYQIPKCNCGNELVWWSQPTYTVRFKINKNGKKSKNPIKNGACYEEEGPYERLECRKCDKEYSIEYDDKGRIIRGEEWSISMRGC